MVIMMIQINIITITNNRQPGYDDYLPMRQNGQTREFHDPGFSICIYIYIYIYISMIH